LSQQVLFVSTNLLAIHSNSTFYGLTIEFPNAGQEAIEEFKKTLPTLDELEDTRIYIELG
jgi:hypothetical protein